MAPRRQTRRAKKQKDVAVGTATSAAVARDARRDRAIKKVQVASASSKTEPAEATPVLAGLQPHSASLRKRKKQINQETLQRQEQATLAKKPKTKREPTRSSARLARSPTTTVKEEPPKAEVKVEKKTAAKRPLTKAQRRRSEADAVPPQPSLPIITRPPTEPLAILVCGTGDFAELGLGPEQQSSDVLVVNPFLDPVDESAYHVVQFACGGMHTVALTADNRIVTWGVNDHGALGRDTAWDDDQMRDIDHESDSENGSLNPHESTPKEISMEHFAEGARIAQVAASDSCSFALTDTGTVYGWGTFLDPNGNAQFGTDATGKRIKKQETPVLIPELKGIKQIACGDNHALALDNKGVIWAWGAGHKNQLGKRLRTRAAYNLKPMRVEIFRQKARYVASGSYHSFAVDENDDVWSWGINGFGQAGDPLSAGEHEAVLPYPRKIASLCGRGVHIIAAGEHHSAAVTRDGTCLMFGRIDGGQLGLQFTQRQIRDKSHILLDERKKPRICVRPTPITGTGPIAHIACNTGHTVFISRDGTGYATGLGSEGQLGNGADEDVDVPRPFQRSESLDGRKLVSAGAGAGFSIVAAEANG